MAFDLIRLKCPGRLLGFIHLITEAIPDNSTKDMIVRSVVVQLSQTMFETSREGRIDMLEALLALGEQCHNAQERKNDDLQDTDS